MGLEKVTYVDGTTVITAKNLNDIQDSVIDLEASRTVPSNVRNAIYTLLENAAYATTGLEAEIAVVEAWAEEITSLSLSVSTLALDSDNPEIIIATTVPIGVSVNWSSSDNTIATVSEGVVTGVANGTCVVTASAGDLVATCDVTVSGFVEVVSISAVYTQSGTVYDTDPLDDLKEDLVVTATYSDSSTEIIPSTDYTLSGTLTVGTSTITVTYQGKTTTFTVTVTENTVTEGTYTPINVVRGSYIDENGDVQTATDNSGYFAEYICLDTSHQYWLEWTNAPSDPNKVNWRISEYDADKEFISQTHLSHSTSDRRTALKIPINQSTKYIRLGWYNDSTSFVPVFNFTYCLALPMSIGGINATTGADESNGHRIRSGYIDAGASMSFSGKPFGGVWTPSGGYAFRCYNSSKAFIGSLTNDGGLFNTDISTQSYPSNTEYIRIFMNYPTGSSYTFTSGWSKTVSELITINGTKYCLTEA